ncbi:uncharacterized protein LOC134459216 isoform X1 [Engraulis encrasicolus]|uniref:uncharacterized protein LOC134459216 isoform X1 n=1 Tax=Engraulis encrasicolus TaxID=184585 RepID=UPI002FD1A564
MAEVSKGLKTAFYRVNHKLQNMTNVVFLILCVVIFMAGLELVGLNHRSLLLKSAGIFIVSTFSKYDQAKELKTRPLVGYITATVIGVALFLTDGILVTMAFAKALSKLSSLTTDVGTSTILTFSMVLSGIMAVVLWFIHFAPAIFGIIGVIQAARLIHQLHRREVTRQEGEQQPPDHPEVGRGALHAISPPLLNTPSSNQSPRIEQSSRSDTHVLSSSPKDCELHPISQTNTYNLSTSPEYKPILQTNTHHLSSPAE